jgi:predicted  nucleic acid-binding Zn-ribbon protein
MAKVGAQRAAELTGKSKSTIQRAMKAGKLSYEVLDNGRRAIDVSELERVFGLEEKTATPQAQANVVEAELQKAKDMIEMERLKMRIRSLEDQLHTVNEQMNDVKEQRDQWQKQAQQVLLTNQHTQQQADELKKQLAEREERERIMRQKRMSQQMQQLQRRTQNQNPAARVQQAPQQAQPAQSDGLWARLTGKKKVA